MEPSVIERMEKAGPGSSAAPLEPPCQLHVESKVLSSFNNNNQHLLHIKEHLSCWPMPGTESYPAPASFGPATATASHTNVIDRVLLGMLLWRRPSVTDERNESQLKQQFQNKMLLRETCQPHLQLQKYSGTLANRPEASTTTTTIHHHHHPACPLTNLLQKTA